MCWSCKETLEELLDEILQHATIHIKLTMEYKNYCVKGSCNQTKPKILPTVLDVLHSVLCWNNVACSMHIQNNNKYKNQITIHQRIIGQITLHTNFWMNKMQFGTLLVTELEAFLEHTKCRFAMLNKTTTEGSFAFISAFGHDYSTPLPFYHCGQIKKSTWKQLFFFRSPSFFEYNSGTELLLKKGGFLSLQHH